jgi:hypothetical protein
MEVAKSGFSPAASSADYDTAEGFIISINGKWIKLSNGNDYSVFNPASIKAGVGDYTKIRFKAKEYNGKMYNNVTGQVFPSKPPPGEVGGPFFSASGITGGLAPATRWSEIPTPSYEPPAFARSSKVGEPELHKDRLILRQNAMTSAVRLVNTAVSFLTPGTTLTPQEVFETALKYAELIENYTSGDRDVANVSNKKKSNELAISGLSPESD